MARAICPFAGRRIARGSFEETISRQTAPLSEHAGDGFEVDDKELRRALLSWLTAFEAQLPFQEQEKPDCVNFAAG